MSSQDDQSLYADMRAAIRGDRERAERRAEKKGSTPPSTSPPATLLATPAPATSGRRRFAGMRRLFGGRRDPS
jgi:hypothetical protein